MPLTSSISADFSGSKDLALFDATVSPATFQLFETVGGSVDQSTGELVIEPTDNTNEYNGYSTRTDLELELDTAYASLKTANLPYGVFNGALATFAVGFADEGNINARAGHFAAFQIESVGADAINIICAWNYFGTTGDPVTVAYDPDVHGKFRFKAVLTGTPTLLWQFCGPADDASDEGSWTTLRDLANDGASPPAYEPLTSCMISLTGQNFGFVSDVLVAWDDLNVSGSVGGGFQAAWATSANQVIGAM